jgi:hypothetical protein
MRRHAKEQLTETVRPTIKVSERDGDAWRLAGQETGVTGVKVKCVGFWSDF